MDLSQETFEVAHLLQPLVVPWHQVLRAKNVAKGFIVRRTLDAAWRLIVLYQKLLF